MKFSTLWIDIIKLYLLTNSSVLKLFYENCIKNGIIKKRFNQKRY